MFGFMEAMLSFLRRQVGLRTDGANASGSLHAKVIDVKNTINSKLATNIGTPTDTRASNTVMGFASTQIKSIQSGSLQRAVNDTFAYKDIIISPVNTDKAIVLCSTSVRTSGYDPTLYMVRARLTSANALRFEAGAKGNTDTDWQVIEFY